MRRRLVLAIAGVAGCAVLLFALPLAVALERSYRDEELLRLQRDTDAATRSIDLSPRTGDVIEIPRFTGRIGLYSVGGVRVAGSGPARADVTTRRALRTGAPAGTAPDGRLVVAVPLRNGERIAGAVRAQRSQTGVAAHARRAWLALGALGAGVVILAVLAALALGRRLARPLDTLAMVARRVGEGNFAARVPSTRISEIDEVGDALNSSSRRIAELVSRERSFSADASHQLRTPLAALRLELESLTLSNASPAPEIEAALTQVDRLQARIETLLSVGREAPGGGRRTDLAAAARDLEARWRGPLAALGRPLHVFVDADPAEAAVSPPVLAEITDVLMNNAETHGAGAVSIRVRDVGDALALEVGDRGRGFGPDPDAAFRRGNGSGHGIGLSLARSLAHAEGARLEITRRAPHPTVSLLIAPAPDRAGAPRGDGRRPEA